MHLYRLGELLQFVMLVVFSVFWAAMLDYLTFLFNCDWKNFNMEPGAVHKSFPEYSKCQHFLIFNPS